MAEINIGGMVGYAVPVKADCPHVDQLYLPELSDEAAGVALEAACEECGAFWRCSFAITRLGFAGKITGGGY